MKVSNALGILSALTFGVALLSGTAYAGDFYQCSIIEAPAAGLDATPVNTSDFHLGKSGKLKIAPANSAKFPGTASTLQLLLTKVDCVAEGNDQGKDNQCGISQDPLKCKAAGKPQVCCTGVGTGPTCQTVPAVLDLSVHQFMTPAFGIDMMHVAGIPIHFTKGMATFDASGSNKVDGSQIFAFLVGAILGQPMGYNVTVIRTQGTVPGDCVGAPPGPHCLDGIEFAFTGFTNGN
jgi:hypothetical protein